ncbi:MAG TPA: ATP-binding cassette domain-containing protein, partial [Nannocystaceae bacterium]|nr:ATP-binding cassette domain-containing protein [Nannocystaceae bacterium]
MSPPVVAIEGARKVFGEHVAVDALDLVIPEGALYGFIGPNGSGKTTTLRMILRIILPDQGRVVVFGKDRGRAADDRIGYLPEERGLYRKMKVAELLRFHAELKGVRRPQAAIAAWLDRLGLGAWADKTVEALSKGMAQKVQFVAAVVHGPALVILDEPFSGLDPVNLEVLKDAMLELRRQGTTVIFSTHDMATAERLCDQLMMIHRGRKVLEGSPAAIRQRYGHDTVRVRLARPDLALADLPGVAAINDYAAYKELRLADGADPQALLHALLARSPVDLFEVSAPSLHDIFVRIAGPGA